MYASFLSVAQRFRIVLFVIIYVTCKDVCPCFQYTFRCTHIKIYIYFFYLIFWPYSVCIVLATLSQVVFAAYCQILLWRQNDLISGVLIVIGVHSTCPLRGSNYTSMYFSSHMWINHVCLKLIHFTPVTCSQLPLLLTSKLQEFLPRFRHFCSWVQSVWLCQNFLFV